ncbi:fibropellin-1-like [Branchiostoma lanceolatum]|uniref:fibropellin-1-like n=1 Tax=Branchiostoma lanceolatum TaxID=7740 RepID=UPI003452DDA3
MTGALCETGGTCHELADGFSCSCPAGLSGALCETDVDECQRDAQLCSPGGACINLYSNYSCTCHPGFSGPSCQTYDPCTSHPCKHGGQCSAAGNTFQCECPDGYQGRLCEEEVLACNSAPCQHGGTCTDTQDGFICTCLTGLTGRTCADQVDVCASEPCTHGGTCLAGLGDFTCLCTPAYAGLRCERPQLCSFPLQDPCQNGAVCFPLPGGAGVRCVCLTGFTGDQCETNIDDCQPDSCGPHGRCVDGVNSYSCECDVGYQGQHCQDQLQLCQPNPCRNNGFCCAYGLPCGQHLQPGERECFCANGFTGQLCQVELDECSQPDLSPHCLNGGLCLDAVGAYRCVCAAGYSGARCEVTAPCAAQPCGAGQCVESGAAYSCVCPPELTGQYCGIRIPTSTLSTRTTPWSQDTTASSSTAPSVPVQTSGQDTTASSSTAPSVPGQDTTASSSTAPSVPGQETTASSSTAPSVPGQETTASSSTTPSVPGQETTASSSTAPSVPGQETTASSSTTPSVPGQETTASSSTAPSVPVQTSGSAPTQTVVSVCASQPCLNGGTCVVDSSNAGFNCSCVEGFLGDVCEVEDRCAQVTCRNGGTCIMNEDGQATCLCTHLYTGDSCSQALSFSLAQFSGQSYLQYPQHLPAVSSRQTRLAMVVRTTQDNCLLLWLGDPQGVGDFLSLGFYQGQLELRFNLGGGIAEITASAVNINNGQFWKVLLDRRDREGQLTVTGLDGTELQFTSMSPGGAVGLNAVNNNLYIGGHPSPAVQVSAGRYTSGLVGCVASLEFPQDNGADLQAVDLQQGATGGLDISNCLV